MTNEPSISSPRKSEVRDLPRWLTIGGPAFAILFLAAALVVYLSHFSETASSPETWGQFGDFFGGLLNPLFGFLAFLLLLATLFLQNRELQYSTHELAESAKALKLQNDALAQQNFENTFFQMLRRISDLVSQTKRKGRVEVTTNNRQESVYGREAFEKMFKSLHAQYQRGALNLDTSTRVEQAYQVFYSETRGELGHYFRSLYHLFTFIDRSTLSEIDKSTYANIARAQLSTYELCLLFYNGTWGEGKAGFRPLIEKYGILKHVDARDLLDPAHMDNRDFYEPTAFMGRKERQEYNDAIPMRVNRAIETLGIQLS